MANSLKHSSVGTELTQAEWEAIDGHVIESQATGDTIYAASSTSLRRLAIGSAGQLLEIASGLPAWTSSPTIGSTSWANANHAHAASNSGGTVAGSALSGSSLASGITSSSLTSVGTLTTLTVDNIIVNGTTIGHTSDTDLLTFADGVLTVAGEISVTTLDIGGTNITSTAAELNLLDGSSANTVVNSKAVVYGGSGELAGTLSTAAQTNVTSLGTLTALTGGTGDLTWDTNTLFVDSSLDSIGIGTTTPGENFAGGTGDYTGTGIRTLHLAGNATRSFFLLEGTTDASVIFGDSGNGSDKKKFGLVFQGETLDVGFITDSAKGINTGTGALAIDTNSNVKIPSGDLDLNNNDIYNVGHADNDWTGTALTVKGYIEQVATYEYQVIKISGSDPHLFKIIDQKNSVADNTSDDLFKITSIISQSTMFTGYVDYVVMSDYQETIEAGRFLITGGRRWASGNAVVQIEKVYSDTADARGGGETITVSLAGTVSGATDAANDITFAMTVDTQHGNAWNLKYDATIFGGYAAGGSSAEMITVTRL
jgi:hypothetical protein